VSGRSIPLFWRLFIPNAAVLGAACVVLMVQPADGRVVALVGGLGVMLAVNLVLMRRSFAPLVRLTSLMQRVDPLRPGERVPVPSQESEVTVMARSFNEMLDRLEAERRESGRRALAERESERRLLASELHDEIGQRLTALALQLNRLAERLPPGVHHEAAAARDEALAAVDEVRGLAQRLRPEVLDDLGLVPALVNLAERLSAGTGLRVERRLDRDLPSLDSDAELVLYRVAQESLTNVVRHADAVSAEVTLRHQDAAVVLCVRDDGRGIAPADLGRSGIRGMRERALLVGGRLGIWPLREGGTEVRLELPIDDTRDGDS
jgi:two-component system, NarL family, sensor histidine kinase UhpB